MQYKIPIQIENEDPIVFWLSLRQLMIIIWWLAIWYAFYNSITPVFWNWIGVIFLVLFWVLWFWIAVVKVSEMTFMVLVVNMIRFWVNYKERHWIKWIDSFSALEIGYITTNQKNSQQKVDFSNKMDKIKNIEEQLKKI